MITFGNVFIEKKITHYLYLCEIVLGIIFKYIFFIVCLQLSSYRSTSEDRLKYDREYTQMMSLHRKQNLIDIKQKNFYLEI
jgi:hypothetical protein